MKTKTEISGKNILIIVAITFNVLLGWSAWTSSHEAAVLRGEIEGLREILQPQPETKRPMIFEC